MDNQRITDAVIAVQNGDNSSWNILDDEFRNQVYRFCLDKVKNPYEAEELTQQTIVSAYQNIGNLKNPKRFKPWLLTIANNKCTDYYRKIQRNVNYSAVGDEDTDAAFDNVIEDNSDSYPEIKLDESTQRKILRKFIGNLPKEQAQCIELKYFQGLKGSEIAALIGVNANTVRSRLRYGEANLKKQILEYEKRTKTKLRFSANYSYSNQLAGNSGRSRFTAPAVVAVITALVVAASVVFGVFLYNNSKVTTTPENQISESSLANNMPQADILNNIAGKYILTNANGEKQSECIVNSDGTVNGTYTESTSKSGSNYDSTVYKCDWKATLDNLSKLNGYSYNFSINNITYDHTPKTEEIINSVRTVYTSAAGISEGAEITVYTPETPVSELDSSLKTNSQVSRYSAGDKLNSYMIVLEDEEKLYPYFLESDQIATAVSTVTVETSPDSYSSGAVSSVRNPG